MKQSDAGSITSIAGNIASMVETGVITAAVGTQLAGGLDLYSKLCAELGDTQYRIETLQRHREELLAQLKALNVLNTLGQSKP